MRLYSVVVDAVAVSAAQDILNLTATAGMALRIHKIEMGQSSIAAWEAKPVKMIINPATVAAGSGGSAVTPRGIDAGGRATAATFTARRNDTTGQTTSGTAQIIESRDWEFLNGFFWMPAPEQRPIIKPSEGFALALASAPSGAMSVSASIWVEELF